MRIDEILESLRQRGFFDEAELFKWPTNGQTQIDAVIEELGEVARSFRRYRQAGAHADRDAIAIEAADVVISAVCLLGTIVGWDADRVIRAKCEADERRGYLHTGETHP